MNKDKKETPMAAPTATMFLRSVAVVLSLAALAKVFSAGGTDQILSRPDPLLLLSTRHVLVLTALVELAASVYLLAGNRSRGKFYVILWLSSVFFLYRAFVWQLAPGSPCPCLGTAASNLGIKPTTADAFLKLVLGYMLVGSALFLLWERLRCKRLPDTLVRYSSKA